jgi:hypothetical protein
MTAPTITLALDAHELDTLEHGLAFMVEEHVDETSSSVRLLERLREAQDDLFGEAVEVDAS